MPALDRALKTAVCCPLRRHGELPLGRRPGKILLMQVYALTSSQLLYETLDLFLTREAADAELREILLDEPDWRDVPRIVPIELDERHVSAN